MKIIRNEKLIKRNGKIGEYASLAGLILLLVPAIYFFQQSFQGKADQVSSLLVFIPIIVGMLLSQVGMYYSARFGRSPRPDESLDAGLKGLPGESSIYHFNTPASHLLVSLAGIWVLLPYHVAGKVSYTKKRWKLTGGGFLQGYMRLFGQETIGRPDSDAETEITALQKEFAKFMEADQVPPISAVLVFVNDAAELDAADAPIPAVKLKQLKDFFRQKLKTPSLSSAQLEKIKSILPAEE